MKTINLLPKFKQEELRYYITLQGLWAIVTLSLISFALVFLAQIGTKLYLEQQAGSIKDQITLLQGQVNQQKNSDVKNQVTTINNLIADYKMLEIDSPKWSKVIKAFTKIPPKGLRVSNFSINPQQKSISIYGISPTRDLVIQLYNNILQDNSDFYNVDYPLENIVSPTNVSYHFTFYFQNKLTQ